MRPATLDAYQLLHEGTIALSQVEANGMRIDIAHLDRMAKETSTKITEVEKELRSDPLYRKWHRKYGDRTNFESRPQLESLLNSEGVHPDSMEKESLAKHDVPFLKLYTRRMDLRKVESTYLGGLRKHIQDGFIHPSINLNTVKTYRSSCSDPNGQNFPVRVEEFAKIVRECFIPRSDNYILGENDFKGIEVGTAACYNKDPVLIEYVSNPKKDMHRDQAMLIYKLKKEEVHKNTRYAAKNMFVFPEFYGSYWYDCSANLWDAPELLKLKVEGKDTLLREHMEAVGLGKRGTADADGKPRPGTFQHHVMEVEADFWKRFKVYAEWKKKWIRDYQKNGGYQLLTGFVVEGVFKRNQIINGAVQGTAFHMLLWTLIKLQKWLNKYNMRSKIIMQIHDSIIADIHRKELEDYLAKVDHIVSVELPKHFPWICVPMQVEAELCPPGMSWYHKKEMKPLTAPEGMSKLSWNKAAKEGKGNWEWN